MAITFEEKLQKIKQNRSNALNSKLAIEGALADAQEELEFNNQYLWGTPDLNEAITSGSIGVQDLIRLYYTELQQSVGRTFSAPTLANYTRANWNSEFQNIINNSPTLEYLTDNGIGTETTLGIYEDAETVITEIGTEATNSDYRGITDNAGSVTFDNTYATYNLAETAAQDLALADKGSGLWGLRTQNGDETDTVGTVTYYTDDTYATLTGKIDSGGNELTVIEINSGSSGVPGSIVNYSFSVGINGVDAPSYYGNQTTFTDEIETLLDNLTAHDSNLTTISTEIGLIVDVDGSNTLWQESNMSAVDDRSNINTLKGLLKLGIGGDTVSAETVHGYYEFFETPTGTNTDFNTYLDELKSLCEIIQSTLQSRVATIIANIGTTENDNLKKWRKFWVEASTGNNGAFRTENALDGALSDINSETLPSANDQLVNLLGDIPEEFIPTPTVFATYYNPKRNDAGIITQRRVGMVYDGQQHATEYKIYRDLASNVSVSNDDWGIAAHDTFTAINPETGTIKVEYVDTNVSQGLIYIYRIRTRDTSAQDSENPSGSKESKIYQDQNSFSFTITGQSTFEENAVSILSVTPATATTPFNFSAGGWCAITGSEEGWYQIVNADEEELSLTIFPAVSTSSNIYPTSSVVFVSE